MDLEAKQLKDQRIEKEITKRNDLHWLICGKKGR